MVTVLEMGKSLLYFLQLKQDPGKILRITPWQIVVLLRGKP